VDDISIERTAMEMFSWEEPWGAVLFGGAQEKHGLLLNQRKKI